MLYGERVDDAPVVRVRALANGGEGVATLADGRAVFVAGALPGEDVRIELVEERRRYARARLVEVLVAAPERREPPCRWHRAGCGGCDLMHASTEYQRLAKVQLARESLQRLGGLADPVVVAGPALPTAALRTTVRVAVLDGRAAFRQRASHDLVAVEDCLVAHPALVELIVEGRFGSAQEATLRVGAATGERLVVVAPHARGVRLPADVVVVGADELAARQPRAAHLHEVVDGQRWRISAASFFQTSAVGAQALVDAVRHAIGPDAASATASPGERRALDAYCGVGLLSAALPGDAAIVAVESSGSSIADARHNLAGKQVEVVHQRVERWRASPVDVAVADPARRGLGRQAAEVLAATGAATLVLVSCDLAALGRDSADLGALGYDHDGSTVLDLFPHTAHAEVVTRFRRR